MKSNFQCTGRNLQKEREREDNYVKNDLGYLIPSHESVKIRFFLPSQEKYPKGKYKLQLLFRNTSKSIDYYIDKIFVHTVLKF